MAESLGSGFVLEEDNKITIWLQASEDMSKEAKFYSKIIYNVVNGIQLLLLSKKISVIEDGFHEDIKSVWKNCCYFFEDGDKLTIFAKNINRPGFSKKEYQGIKVISMTSEDKTIDFTFLNPETNKNEKNKVIQKDETHYLNFAREEDFHEEIEEKITIPPQMQLRIINRIKKKNV